jgi:uncharacterized DUF497 family protein
MLLFEWDPSKAKINIKIHGISFDEVRRCVMKKMPKDLEMLEEYDFSQGIQGKYAAKYARGTNVVVIEPDVARVFPHHDSVNQALRSLAEIIKRQKKLANKEPKC